jgi:hypothetical protein
MTDGREFPADAPCRFVVLAHTDRHGLHFDLMIDLGERLATWKCLLPPEQSGAAGQPCVRLADHRHSYLDYEGPVSGDRGDVRRHDAGACTVLEHTDDRWRVNFAGRRLIGRYKLLTADRLAEEPPREQSPRTAVRGLWRLKLADQVQ